MRKIASFLVFLALVLISCLARNCNAQGCLEMEIVLLVNVSGSVKGHELQVNTAVASFVKYLGLSEEGIRVGIVTFDDVTHIVHPLSGDSSSILSTLGDMFINYNSTDMAIGINTCTNMFNNQAREHVKKMLIIISDGDVDNQDSALEQASFIKKRGVGICTVLILNNSSKEPFMSQIADGCYVKSSYENLVDEIKKLDICI